MSFEIRHLRAFVAVAEELNFTRAAERIHTSQQSLSTQIRQLEERVGTPLVKRTTRKVELTEAGSAFYDHAVGILAATEAAGAAALAATGEKLRLNVGFTTPFDHEPIRPVLDAFAELRPDVDQHLMFGDIADTSGGARRDDVDIGVAAGPFDRTGLEFQPLWTEPLGVVMATGHELASRERISVDEYLAEPIFDYPSPDIAAREFWMGTRFRQGRPPRYVAQFHSLDALLEAARAGLGVALIRERVVDSRGPDSGIVFRPLDNGDTVEMSLAWRAGDEREMVTEFVAAGREAFGR